LLIYCCSAVNEQDTPFSTPHTNVWQGEHGNS